MSGDPRVPVIIIIIYYLSPFTILCTCACSFLVAYFQSSKGLAFCFCLEPHLKSDHGVGTVWGSCVKGQNNLEAKGVGNLDLTDVLTLTYTFLFFLTVCILRCLLCVHCLIGTTSMENLLQVGLAEAYLISNACKCNFCQHLKKVCEV